ncbi:hypothetical protein [Pseudaquabacterium rugosum]|uniref:Uncharacterized protein n=1 Tax=Pseudaquabacterium rugosum TaxID=2984194 RepID=A0ABU9BKU9_9BURK
MLALWNDVDPARADDYEHWHRHEHVPERCTVPGLHWGLRWARADDGPGPRFFTLYGLRDAQVLEEPAYQRLLTHPTPTSLSMRPALRNLQRWVCAVPAGQMAAGVLAGLHGAGWLRVWTRCVGAGLGVEVAAEPAEADAPSAAGAAGSDAEVLWLARQADVQALPWVTAGQTADPRGTVVLDDRRDQADWLGLAAGAGPGDRPGGGRNGASIWRRLAVGK